MKMSYPELKSKPKTFQSLAGLNSQEFERLLNSFGEAWGAYVQETFYRKDRQRGYGAGRKAELEHLEDKLLFILVYFRLYPTQEVQGYLFGIGQAQANEWVHRLTRVLNQALGHEQQLPEREPSKLEQVLTACPSLELSSMAPSAWITMRMMS
jgi:Helix-turn-helix of DDE superfamily endonuclease